MVIHRHGWAVVEYFASCQRDAYPDSLAPSVARRRPRAEAGADLTDAVVTCPPGLFAMAIRLLAPDQANQSPGFLLQKPIEHTHSGGN